MRSLLPTARLAVVLAPLLVLASLTPVWAPGAPSISQPPPQVTITRAADYVPRGGTVDIAAEVTLAGPARLLTVRFRILSPTDALVEQHSETRSRLAAGPQLFKLQRSAAAMGLREGIYRLEVRAEAEGSAPVTLTEPLIVVDTTRAPLPVSVIVRLKGGPLFGPDGRLASDPATRTAARDEATALARMRDARPDILLSLAVPPLLLDEWRTLGKGYTPPRGAAAGAVSAEAPAPAAYRSALSAIAGASASGLRLIAVPFAEPDLTDLASIGALDDVSAQLDLGARTTSETLGAAADSGVLIDGSSLYEPVTATLEQRRAGYAVLVSPTGSATQTPGVYALEGHATRVLVSDSDASALLGDARTGRLDVLTYLHRRASAKKTSEQPVVAIVEIGEGASTTVADLETALSALQRVSWIRLVEPPEAASMRVAGTLTAPNAPAEGGATEYWRSVQSARTRSLALTAAAGPLDADAAACARDIMLAESHLLADPLAPKGEPYAAEAERRAGAVLSHLSLTAPDVTLSGTSGKVRVSVSNTSNKVLRLTLVAAPTGLRISGADRIALEAPPGETIMTVPVEVRSSLSGSLGLTLLAGTLDVAAARSTVRAGFMDRLAVIVTVVLVLSVLLWYIRRRGSAAIQEMRNAAAARGLAPNGRPKDTP